MRRYLGAGFVALLVLIIALGIYATREGQRMALAQADLRENAVGDAAATYVEYCAACHGASGEGVGATPALDSDGLRGTDYDTLFKTIARGRYGTAMAGWQVDEGGMLNDYQVDQLVAMIRYVDWAQVRELAARRGMIPASLEPPAVAQSQLDVIAALGPQGGAWGVGLTIFAENCTVCHGVSGAGSSMGVALNTPELREKDAATLARTVAEGVPGTMMAGWGKALTPEEIDQVVGFLLHWDEVEAAGVALTAPTIAQIDLGDAAAVLALGERLFSSTCTTCHGEAGAGGVGPAINSRQFLSNRDDAQIEQAIVQGGRRPGSSMPAFGDRLTSVEIDALVRYIRSLEATAPVVENPRGSEQGGGGPPWLRGTATPGAGAPPAPGGGRGGGGGPPPWAGGGK